MRRVSVSVTTDASGDGATTQIAGAVLGLLYAVQLVDGNFDDGVDITLTSEQGDLSIPLLVKANFNSDQMVYPRVLEALNTDGTSLSTHALPLVAGYIKALVAAGGNVKTGTFIFYILD